MSTLTEWAESAEAAAPLPANTGVLFCCDKSGDTRVAWDHRNAVEVENARATFDRLRGQGYIAYSCKDDGTPDKVITTFDPKAGKVILTPPLQGG